jgi:AbrB family looped-hinge helix DNA binding protein
MIRARTTLTRKGQITVPVEIRRALGLKEGDKITVILADGVARLERTGSVVERTRGIIKSSSPPLSAEELREEAELAIAEEADKRSR